MSTGSNYEWSIAYLFRVTDTAGIEKIAEVGSRDATDAVFLSEKFGANVVVFEPDPGNARICRETLQRYSSPKLRLRELALSDETGLIDFYSVDPLLYDNTGSSSLFEINFSKRPPNDPDRDRPSVQKKISVSASRFDHLNESIPDLIFMDCEGSELKVLRGFGAALERVRAVVFETSFWNNFKGRAQTFREMDAFLAGKGFVFVASNRSGQTFPKNKWRARIFPRYQRAFDVLYANKTYLRAM